jgi:hypothetical protein
MIAGELPGRHIDLEPKDILRAVGRPINTTALLKFNEGFAC